MFNDLNPKQLTKHLVFASNIIIGPFSLVDNHSERLFAGVVEFRIRFEMIGQTLLKEHLVGKSKLYCGTELVSRPIYDIRIYWEPMLNSDRSDILEGQMRENMQENINPLMDVNSDLTLMMEDGRQLEFHIVNEPAGIIARRLIFHYPKLVINKTIRCYKQSSFGRLK
jgi:hypothetical protein